MLTTHQAFTRLTRHPAMLYVLLDSLPAIDKPLEEEWALRKTDLPGNRTLPQGCFFYERCPLATHGCEVRQSLTIREDGREIRCWRAL
ncbi:oligopeptide/dipeptide ABC transporter ATP-binding protein [Escherichia coli]|nr:oligopeptide/dipeptide ABC transporter ATP-binding protein [Escherichia coli]